MQPLCRVALLLALSFAGSAFAAGKKQPPKTPPVQTQTPPVETPPVKKEEPPVEPPPVEKKKEETPPATKDNAATGSGALSDSPDKAKKEVAAVDRIGVSLDLYGEASRMNGEQWVNQFRADESFDYTAGPLAASVYLLFHPADHVRLGPSVRFLGNYGNDRFKFGYLTELYAQGEYALRAFEQFDILFGGKAGVSVLFPGEEFAEEIRRLQAQGAPVWSLPRVGWVAGLNVGLRRKIAGNLYGRFELGGQLGHIWLFSTDAIVDQLRFRKFWGDDIPRLGANLGVEVAF